MNGSRTSLIVPIVILSLLPWAFIFLVFTQGEPGSFRLDDANAKGANSRTETTFELKEKISELEQEIEELTKKNRDLREQLSEAGGKDGDKIAELQRRLAEEKSARLDAEEKAERLQSEYNDAMSKIVQLQTEKSSAPPPTSSESTPEPEAEAGGNRPAPRSGGWITPPSDG